MGLSSEKYRILYTKTNLANALYMRLYMTFAEDDKGSEKTLKWLILEVFNPYFLWLCGHFDATFSSLSAPLRQLDSPEGSMLTDGGWRSPRRFSFRFLLCVYSLY